MDRRPDDALLEAALLKTTFVVVLEAARALVLMLGFGAATSSVRATVRAPEAIVFPATALGGRPGLRFSRTTAPVTALGGRPGLRFRASAPFETDEVFVGTETTEGWGDDSFRGLPGLRFGADVAGTEVRESVRAMHSR